MINKHLGTKILRTTILLVGACLILCSPKLAHSEEPGENFLKQLRANRYYDMALAYLDRIEAGASASDELRNAIDLERAQTHLEAASNSRIPKDRNARYEKGEAALRAFIDKHKTHPRFGEANLQLGNLLLIRGLTLVSAPEVDEKDKAAARKSFDDAAVVYDAIVEELRGKLKAMQGNKTDADDANQLALRNRYRGEFLSAILRGGEVRERAADTLPDSAPDRKKRYDDALTKYKELADNYGSKLPGAQAAFYIGRVLEKKGDIDAALKAYQDTMKLPEADQLRIQKTEAAALAINILLSKSPPQADAAIQIGRPWMNGLRPNERNVPQWQLLRVALARAYTQLASTQKSGEAKKSVAMANALLKEAAKVPGEHLDEARKLLSQYGSPAAEPSATEDVPEPKSYSEALASAREMLEAIDVAQLAIDNLEQQIKAGTGDKAQLQDQLDAAKDGMAKMRAALSAVLESGFALATSEDSTDTLNQGRYLMAMNEFQRQRYWDATVVGEFVAHRYYSDPLALQCGLIALSSYQSMLQAADDASRPEVMRKIQPLATFLTKQWPNDPNSKAAAILLVQIAMLEKQWDQAEQSLAQFADENPAKAKFYTVLGLSLWNVYQQESSADRADAAAASATHDAAVKNLQQGLKLVKADAVDGNTLLGALLVAKSELKDGKALAALNTLDNPTYGPIKRFKGDNPVQAPQGVLPDTYRTALTALFAQLKDGGAADKLLPRAEAIMEDMRNGLKADPEGSKKLIGIYFALAKDVRQQIDQSPPEKKAKLIDLFSLLLNNLGEQATDSATIHWVAQTLIELGESAMGNQNPPAAGQAKKLLAGAAAQLKTLIDNGKEDPDTVRTLRFELATSSRMLGEYKTAIDQLDEILKEKNSMIDAQSAAALSYQQWALSPGFNPKFIESALKRAIYGARPNKANKSKNNIWGWAALAELTQGKQAFESTFFEARYRIAECVYEIGQKAPGEDKAKQAKQAQSVILGTLKAYPKLGGQEDIARNDRLFRKLQQAQNQPVTGLP